jgi:hypothetical protein
VDRRRRTAARDRVDDSSRILRALDDEDPEDGSAGALAPT